MNNTIKCIKYAQKSKYATEIREFCKDREETAAGNRINKKLALAAVCIALISAVIFIFNRNILVNFLCGGAVAVSMILSSKSNSIIAVTIAPLSLAVIYAAFIYHFIL
jgi:hypothetical protein